MKRNTHMKSIFDPCIQQTVFPAAKMQNTFGCIHVSDGIAQNHAELECNAKDQLQLMTFNCSLCQIGFEDLQQQRAHFKSEWHVHNIKQKMAGKETQSEFTFNQIKNEIKDGDNFWYSTESNDDDDDDDCDDGNDCDGDHDDCDDDLRIDVGQSPKVTFIVDDRHFFSVYKTLLKNNSTNACPNCTLFENSVRKLKHENCWIILMLSGGHFAAAVFHKQEACLHKTIHKYVIRAKRGTIQSQRDGKQCGKSPRSAGAHIRRQNEISLVNEIQELLDKWKIHIDHADRIFLKWPQRKKSILFDGKDAILRKLDSRIHKVPFITGKPTFDELKRIHQTLSTFTLQDISYNIQSAMDSEKANKME